MSVTFKIEFPLDPTSQPVFDKLNIIITDTSSVEIVPIDINTFPHEANAQALLEIKKIRIHSDGTKLGDFGQYTKDHASLISSLKDLYDVIGTDTTFQEAFSKYLEDKDKDDEYKSLVSFRHQLKNHVLKALVYNVIKEQSKITPGDLENEKTRYNRLRKLAFDTIPILLNIDALPKDEPGISMNVKKNVNPGPWPVI
jgi:hypothetical protein